jgi:hypothetical protein
MEPRRANGLPAFAIYAGERPFVLQVVELEGDRIAAITSFMNQDLFAFFT